MEPSKPVQVFLRDLSFAQSLAPSAKPAKAFRVVVDGLRMAMESGAIRWTGMGWALAQDAPQEPSAAPNA